MKSLKWKRGEVKTEKITSSKKSMYSLVVDASILVKGFIKERL